MIEGGGTSRTRYPQALLKGLNTPWTSEYELDTDIFVKHTNQLLAHGYTHLYVLGTAGEGYALSDRAFRRIVDVFCDLMDGADLHPQIGVISLSVDHMLERIGYAAERGAGTFQIVLPSWGVMQSDEKVAFFRQVCGAFPEANFLHYNYPYGMNTMAPAEYVMALEAVPNLVATKISTMDMGVVRGLMTQAGELQHFFLQGPFPYGCLYGECSLISSLGPLFPEFSMELFEAGREGDVARAFRIQQRMLDVSAGLYAGVDRRHIDGAYDKLTSWLADPSFPRRLLPPFDPISEEAAQVARRYYESSCSDLS
ncbi:dihydrodipicolinate synthase family protein [Actinomycetota bacterium]